MYDYTGLMKVQYKGGWWVINFSNYPLIFKGWNLYCLKNKIIALLYGQPKFLQSNSV